MKRTSVPHPSIGLAYAATVTDPTDPVLLVMPGFAHREQPFRPLAAALEQRSIGTVVVDIQTGTRNVLSRNLIGLNTYLEGVDCVLDDFRARYGRNIRGVLGHSQGGMLMQEWLQRQSDDSLLAIFLAPIPLAGAREAVMKIALHRPGLFLKILKTFLYADGMSRLKNDEIRTLFFEQGTPANVVRETRRDLTHTPLRVFMQDILRPFVRPQIAQSNRDTLLVTSETDALFPRGSYDDMDERYTNMETAHIGGGHDFFIEEADETARLVAAFMTGK